MKQTDITINRQRRAVLRGIAGTAAASLPANALELFAQALSTDYQTLDRNQVGAILKPLFRTSSPDVDRLLIDAYSDCILGKIRAADPPLSHDFIVPGGGYFAQWIWDTMFVLDLLAILPGQQGVIAEYFKTIGIFSSAGTE